MSSPLRIAFVEPHLGRVGGIRRILELSNRLVERGHEVSIHIPAGDENVPDGWLPCRARVVALPDEVGERYDAVVFNHEPQWHLLGLFDHARARVFYALHYSRLYGKAGSWEALRADVDLVLANSTWTAEMIEAETGRRPRVLLGGVSHEYFHPLDVAKRYPILTMGDKRRPWKGTATAVEAARLLGLPLKRYDGKNLPQSKMALEYCRAEVFVVASEHEGFGQPGLEALACGVPLVTTDNGGSREYAIHEETALVVPPNDPHAMAEAIDRLRHDSDLAARLRENGLALARERFDWERATSELEELLREAAARAPEPTGARRPARTVGRPESPELSVVTLTWDQLHHTQDFVESVRRDTDVSYELVIVDNGSAWEAASYAREAATVAVLNETNLGFAQGMNQGLAAARGRVVAFCNNDTVLPEGWASALIRHLDDPSVGIVVPAITNANHDRTVRSEPGETVERLAPFEPPPPAVVYLMRRETVEALGGWGEEYAIASGEDTDLAFKVWANGLDIVYDSRVLVEHFGKGTAGSKLDDWASLWRRNRNVFLEKWGNPDGRVPYLGHNSEEEFRTRLAIASSVAWWMGRYFETRDKLHRSRLSALRRTTREEAYDATRDQAARVWYALRPHVPWRIESRIERWVSGRYDRAP